MVGAGVTKAVNTKEQMLILTIYCQKLLKHVTVSAVLPTNKLFLFKGGADRRLVGNHLGPVIL